MKCRPWTSSRFFACLLALLLFFNAVALAEPLTLDADDLLGSACLVMDADTGRVLYEKNADKKRYPASTTKIMTLLLALEYGHLDEMITVPKQADNVPSDSTRVPVHQGEKMRFIDLLYGMMVVSGNDAANAIAVIVAGSIEGFVDSMNARAQELGCTGTNFTNAHGYHNEDHYTTARDLAIIAREGMKLAEFHQIVNAKTYTMPATKKREKPLKLKTTDLMIVPSSKFYYEPMIGVKTGSHSKAGDCFVGAATEEGVTLISVTLKSAEDGRWADTERLMRYGFSRYQTYTLDQLYAQNPIAVGIQNADPEDEQGGLLALDAELGGYRVRCLPDELDQKSNELLNSATASYDVELKAPIQRGDILGTLSMTGPDGEPIQTALFASRDVEAQAPALDTGALAGGLAMGALALSVLIFLHFTIARCNRKQARKRKPGCG